MHRLLARQLRKLGLNGVSSPDEQQWDSLARRISDTYQQADDDRYLLERSLQISSDEMQEVFQRQKATSEGRLQALVNAMPDLVFMLDEDGRYVEVIAGEEGRLYLPADDLKGRLLSDILPNEHATFFMDAIHHALTGNSLHLVEYKLEVPAGERVFEGRIMPTGMKVNNRQTVIFLSRDVTELARSRDELEHMATHDGLTGLPNRTLLGERLVQAVARAKRLGSRGALMILDLDRFKQINDSLGHPVGDRVLEVVAQRLLKTCRTEDTVARFGGDEYTLILEDLKNVAHSGRIANHILDAFARPVNIDNFELDITASIGISVFPDDSEDSDTLIKQADNAMYVAKEAGRNQYSFYTEDLGSNALAYLALESRLRKAIISQELALVYQPQFRLCDGILVGLEALVRWPTADPEHRSPAQFIPIAEMSGLIEPLGLWVLDEACRQAASWLREGLDFGRMAINLSSRQLNNPQLVDQVEKIMDKHKLAGDALEFEITESMVVREGGIAHSNIETFGSMGVSLAIDDFGTGHSSLVNLKRFPLNHLKIDRSFVDGVGVDPNDEAIAGATIALARQLGMKVVAEGVETEEQAEFLRGHKCDIVQGFLYAKPMLAGEIEKRFNEKNPVPVGDCAIL
ncbi:MAG: EAL domain-containing protein [Candidatus Sedimenticola sp. (ex Thyasira tokunagai)]